MLLLLGALALAACSRAAGPYAPAASAYGSGGAAHADGADHATVRPAPAPPSDRGGGEASGAGGMSGM